MCEGLHWTEYLKALGPTLIAIFVAYVAYHQWQVQRAVLREKLFDRRFAVFKQTQDFISAIFQENQVSDNSFRAFNEAPQLSRFLFGSNVSSYLDEIRDKAFKAKQHERNRLHSRDEASRISSIDSEEHEKEWLINQLPIIFDKFEPYLGFENHR